MPVYLLSENLSFPSPRLASKEGLLAIGGDLSPERLLLAYRLGIFPWYSDGDPIMWWSPDPRLVLYPQQLRISRSLKRFIKRGRFHVTADRAFGAVIEECARIRRKRQEGTWIVDDMIQAYCRLHEAGFAHSVETWEEAHLVGGLYGLSLGKIFFGESMFARKSNASKVALVALVEHLRTFDFALVDCQVVSSHLKRFGARAIPRSRYLDELTKALAAPTRKGKWSLTD